MGVQGGSYCSCVMPSVALANVLGGGGVIKDHGKELEACVCLWPKLVLQSPSKCCSLAISVTVLFYCCS